MSVRSMLAAIGFLAIGAWSPALAQSSSSQGSAAAPGSSGTAGSTGATEQGGAASQPQGKQGAQAGAQRKEHVRTMVGTVESVSGDKLSLKSKRGKTQELTLSDDTKIEQHGKKASRDDLKQGEEVRAAFRSEKGMLHATDIKILKTGEAGAPSGKSSKKGTSSPSGQEQPQPSK